MAFADKLNDKQNEAVFMTEGPLLILAGAGSGKTRVITNRIAYMIDDGINPYNILAITFTNKAAAEMRQRVDDMVGFGSKSIWVSTFHSMCVRILRREIEALDYDTHFTIYDTDDQKSVIKLVLKRLNLDPKFYPEKQMLGIISNAKERFVGVEEFKKESGTSFRDQQIAKIYEAYQEELKKNNALDFDDLLFKTVELFQFNPDILDRYQERFKYIMVDEYQDTNHIQFLLISQLARKYRNLCVVGDDDQSIYKFRGANIYNILNFEEEYPDAKVIKLEQNYRSTKTILAAANGVIAHNRGRKEKALWADSEEGVKIAFHQYENDHIEAEQTVWQIRKLFQDGYSYRDVAILYRTNAQSRLFEEKLLMANIPYKIVGGLNFYSRKEIKDMIAYLKVIDNGNDDLCTRRIINVPKRGIGATSVDKAAGFAYSNGMTLMEAFYNIEHVPGMNRAAAKITKFTDLIDGFKQESENGESISTLYQSILDETGYLEELELEGTEEAEARIENLEELKNKIVQYEESAEEPTLSGLLEEIALVADIDTVDDEEDRVLLMTLHSAKGLEFPVVFMAGMEEGIFPSAMAIFSDSSDDEVEEERRLCYVGITRAKKRLFMSAAMQRMTRGNIQANAISRFVKEIPSELIDTAGNAIRRDTIRNSVERPKVSNAFSKSIGASSKAFSFGGGAMATMGTKGAEIKKADHLDYGVGDMVKHIKFGKGEVIEITDKGKDYEVTVDFETHGRRKLFASFAKLKKV